MIYKNNDITQPVPTVYGYFNEKYGSVWKAQMETLQSEFGSKILEIKVPYQEQKQDKVDLPTVLVAKDSLITILKFLKESMGYSFLTDLTAIDEELSPPVPGTRFVVVYHLFNIETKSRLRIKVALADQEESPSVTALWSGANWAEREVFDMYGIRFNGHPDLRRILMDQRFEGHPLRKDYPLRGYQVFLTPEPIDPELLK